MPDSHCQSPGNVNTSFQNSNIDEQVFANMGKAEYERFMSEVGKKKYNNNKLRLQYNPQQLNFKRAQKAQNVCEEGGLIDKDAQKKAEEQIYRETDISESPFPAGSPGNKRHLQALKNKAIKDGSPKL